ncbi:fumarylacetoacetate hydrolase family protein [Blastochloris viridis]|uniref:Fumarylacetoacetate hydrolase family protein n=1 Tax=Blastochloris viridis TaxID=1079 RepID=A0A0H5BCE0_BLAVI|nr:fumarylacetoacetate hydrolase family protein [Blastochloris viridis]ALK08739.1 Ureidoglycolate lyase [Blastochloris viridis]BAR97966.1 fumarylacetoacetate hydrolase family protein [Blastochloris viridis]CUU41400.1 Ureidoglycolate lyase [Blastochloris viridis]
MKLCRHGPPGREKSGLVAADGSVRDLSGVLAELNGTTDITGSALAPRTLAKLKKINPDKLPKVSSRARVGACVGGTRNFIAVGMNYADHAAETGSEVPKEPILFNKAPSCIVGPDDNVMIPPGAKKTDWEVELAVVIGSKARYVEEKDALKFVAGFCICNDVSERSFQMERAGQWMKGKSCESFGPLGPWLVTPDEIKDVQNLDMWLDVNGTRMQTGSTKTMVFGVAYLISYISHFMVLEPGDVITTGTPPGVGMGKKPPRYLRPGDVITLGVQGLGMQCQKVVPFA